MKKWAPTGLERAFQSPRDQKRKHGPFVNYKRVLTFGGCGKETLPDFSPDAEQAAGPITDRGRGRGR